MLSSYGVNLTFPYLFGTKVCVSLPCQCSIKVTLETKTWIVLLTWFPDLAIKSSRSGLRPSLFFSRKPATWHEKGKTFVKLPEKLIHCASGWQISKTNNKEMTLSTVTETLIDRKKMGIRHSYDFSGGTHKFQLPLPAQFCYLL